MHCRTSFLELETGLCLKYIVKESNDPLESNHADVIVVMVQILVGSLWQCFINYSVKLIFTVELNSCLLK